MTETLALSQQEPVEILVNGRAMYAGDISSASSHHLVLSNTTQANGKPGTKGLTVHPGKSAEMVFLSLFDDQGKQLSTPVTLESVHGNSLSVVLRKPDDPKCKTILGKLQLVSGGGQEQTPGDTGEILTQFRKRSLHRLDQIMDEFLGHLADHLFDKSADPRMRGRQEELYDSMNTIKRSRQSMRQSFAKNIANYFDDPDSMKRQEAEPVNVEASELNLVDIKTFEEKLELDRIIKGGEHRYAAPLECLTIRFAELNGVDPLDVGLPVDVAQICHSFHDVLENCELPDSVAADIYEFFSSDVVRRLDDFYGTINTFLADQGINPGIEEQVEKHGSVLKLRDKKRPEKPEVERANDLKAKDLTPDKAEEIQAPAGTEESGDSTGAANQGMGDSGAPAGPPGTNFGAAGGSGPGITAPAGANAAAAVASAPGAATTAPAHAPAAEVGAGPSSPHFNPDTLYRSVIEALNFQHQHASGSAGPGATSSAQPGAAGGTGDPEKQANPAMLAAALSSLQHNPEARSEVQSSQSLREYLSDNQGKIAGLKGTDGIGAQSLNQLDLVDNLFGSLRTDVDVAQELQDSLGDLHIPLAKLALMEPQFFVDEKHPARGVIDKLAQLSSSANYPNKALEKRVSGVVENIIQGYETDSGVFDDALVDLQQLVDQQEMALERNVQRVVKTQDGQQKLLRAQLAVEKLLSSRIRPPRAPKLMLDLVEHGWRDLLTLTHVKEGPHSRSWRDYTKTLDLLSLWLIEQQKGISDEQLQMERALEAEPFVDMIRQQVSNELPSNVALEPVLEELLEVLSGHAAVELIDFEQAPFEAKSTPAETRQRIETLPRLRRWVKRVEELEAGVWLRFRDAAGKKRRMQLAWISEEKDRYVFVNERGQKIADLSNVELARQLSRGVQPASPADKLSLVDQSMYNNLETVQKTLSFDNNRDSLTKLINKKAFLEQLELMLNQAKTRHSQHGLIYIDIDQFALVNEVYDEVTGDQVLSEFARLLAQQHSDKISSARLEGDKFAVLLKDRSIEQTVAHAEKIRTDIATSPITIDNDRVSFTVSIGVASVQDFHDSVEQVMANAEFAMRKAKGDGRNKVVEYRDEQSLADEYKSIESAAIAEIEATLEKDSFELRAQPIVQNVPNFAELPVKYYEVLLGIKDEHGELVSPQDFIVSAERFGYMVEVDRWIVNEVFAWIARQMDDQKEIPHLSINLSGTSISDDRFMDYLFEKISDYGVGTNRICFEITETGTISNMTKAADFVRALKNIGCRFSIDDFGTGLSSHNYLRELPVDYLKIDGTFIATIHQNEKDFAMVKSINELAHFLGQQTIAEFVENDEIIASLRTIGVDYLQGWGVGKPIPLTELTKSLPRLQT